MDDKDFFDLLYQQWSKTTGASDTYWMPEEDTENYLGGPHTWNIWAIDQNQERRFIAGYLEEADADFITAVHGCLSDLVRRLHDAVDTAEALDEERDEQETRIADLALELEDLKNEDR